MWSIENVLFLHEKKYLLKVIINEIWRYNNLLQKNFSSISVFSIKNTELKSKKPWVNKRHANIIKNKETSSGNSDFFSEHLHSSLDF